MAIQPSPPIESGRDSTVEPVIEALRLTKRYGDHVAVDDLSFGVRPGEVFGLLGPNGAGKTTTVLMLLGLTEPTSGEARVVGVDPMRDPLEVKRHVGYMPDTVGFYDGLSARENLAYTARLNRLPGALAATRITDLLAQVGLGEVAGQKVDTFSRGMRQRLGVADALLKDPSVLILDEPTASLDPEGVVELLALIERIAQERRIAVLLSSHLLDQVQAICQRVGIFYRGRLIAEGSVRDLASEVSRMQDVVEVGAQAADGRAAGNRAPGREPAAHPGRHRRGGRRGRVGPCPRHRYARDRGAAGSGARLCRAPPDPYPGARGAPGRHLREARPRRGGGPQRRAGTSRDEHDARSPAIDPPGARTRGTAPARTRRSRTGRRRRRTTSVSAPMAAPVEPERGRPRSAIRPPSGGWRIVAGKELADHLGSTRFVVLFIVLGLAGASAVYSVSQQITSVAAGVGTTQSLFPLLFTLSASDIAAATQQSANTPLPSFVALISLLAPLLGIAFGFDAVNRERSERTLPRLLAQPIYRDDVINGKFAAGLAAIGIALGSVLLVIAAWGVIQLGVIPTAEDVARLLVWYLVAIVYIGFWLALATLCSVVMRRAASSALVAISAWLVVSLFGGLLISTAVGLLSPLGSTPTTAEVISNGHLQDALTRISPDGMFQIATQAILDPHVTAGILTIDQRVAVAQQGAAGSILSLDQSLLVVGPQVLAIVALSVVCFALAYVAFMRQEVRA